MAELPSGTVTFLFTDIESSTQLLQRLGPRYGDVLAAYRALLRSVFQAHHGHEAVQPSHDLTGHERETSSR